MISYSANMDDELARMAAGTMRTAEMLEASHHLMASARGARWSQAAAYHGRALCALGRIAEGFALFEEAWQLADRLDDPTGSAISAIFGARCSLMLYDHAEAERWCRREMERRRSRLIFETRFELVDRLASAQCSQGNLPAARETLSEFEGADANHMLLAYLEGEWERAVRILRKEFAHLRALGSLLPLADCGSVLGRLARIANHRVEAETILDESLQVALAMPDLNRELFIRIELALIDIDFGQLDDARRELRRCKEILDNGENWCGHQGAYLHTNALLDAATQILRYVGPDGRWHISSHRRAVAFPDEIEDGFRVAIEIFRRYRAPWEESATLLYWAQALFASSQMRRSMEMFCVAFNLFDQIGTAGWREQIERSMFRFMTLDTLSSPITIGDDTAANLFRKEGDYWTVSFHGTMFRLRDTIGMHYICRLLTNPGTEFAAQNLIGAAQKAPSKRNTKKTHLARRNGRLPGDSDSSDAENVARERARLMVTKRIKDVIVRIRQSNPELARHLATQIRTGYSCRYEPDEAHPERW